MGCTQVHIDVPVLDNTTVPIEDLKSITLTKTSLMHIIGVDMCSAPVEVCVQRVVKCQKGCAFETFLHDFPIDPNDPILPPGEYVFSVPESFIPLFGGPVVSFDLVFEDVTPEFVQAIIANKNGGC